jgi:hypothetical protein
MTATTWRFQVRKRETALTPTLDVQNFMFSNSEFYLHETNFPSYLNHCQRITFVGQEVGQISPKHFLLLHAKIDLLKLKGSRHPSRKS